MRLLGVGPDPGMEGVGVWHSVSLTAFRRNRPTKNTMRRKRRIGRLFADVRRMHRLPFCVIAPRIVATIRLVAFLDRLAFFELSVCRRHLTPRFLEGSLNLPRRPPAQSLRHAMFRGQMCPSATAWAAGEGAGLREDCSPGSNRNTSARRTYSAARRGKFDSAGLCARIHSSGRWSAGVGYSSVAPPITRERGCVIDGRCNIDGWLSMASRFGFRAFVECVLGFPDGYKQHQGDQDSAD